MIYTIQGPVVIFVECMAAKIMLLNSITKGKVKLKRNIDGDSRLKMPPFSECERERPTCIDVFMDEASHNAVAGHLNVHRTKV